MSTLLYEPGEIRHSIRVEETIMKCAELEGAATDDEGGEIPLDMFMLTHEFPKYHYVVIDRVIENYSHPEHPHCLVYLVTHSSNFDNLKVTDDLYVDSEIDLKNSYITRDKFLIHVDNFSERVYGHFGIEKLRDALAY